MIKKLVCVVMVVLLMTSMWGCGSFSDYKQYLEDYDEFQEFKAYKESLQTPETVNDTINYGVSANQVSEPLTEASATGTVSENDISKLKNLVSERNEVYTWEDTYEKTLKINELDRQILEVGKYDFSEIKACFVGDSITEGVGGNRDANGTTISYVDYVNGALHFESVLKNGLAGRTIADHNNPELSIARNETDLVNLDSEIIVFYVGINDYLSPDEEKVFGALDSGSSSGYCGQLEELTKSLQQNYPDKEYFFVTSYQINTTDPSPYKDFEGTPTLNDYMEPQRILAERNGYHIIELYNTGFMSMKDGDTLGHFFADTIHPNNEGYRILGEHIAAEILLYYLGIQQ